MQSHVPIALPQHHFYQDAASRAQWCDSPALAHNMHVHLRGQTLDELFPDLIFHAAHYIIPPGCNLFELQIIGGKSDR